MSEPLERNQVIELLEKLGSEQDEDVLAAARMLHGQIMESGMGWEDLLVGDEPEDEESIEEDFLPEDDDEYDDIAEDIVVPNAMSAVDEKQTLSLIEDLLARNDISSELREELEEDKMDFSGGEFRSSDHRYIHSLHARLTKI